QPLGGTGRRPAGVTRSGPGRGGTTGPGRRSRRWNRLAGPVALAAVSIAAVGLGVTRFTDGQENSASDSAASSQANPEVADPAAAAPFRATGAPQRSGADYTPEDLATGLSPQVRQLASGSPSAGAVSEGGRLAGPGNLDRLADPAALNTCLGEIGAEHGDGPLVVEVVDYARFQGQPALVVGFTDVTGARWAWVSGPECGVPGSGSDSRYRTRVG
ncbi:hypothetical protein NCC78_10090, partial [Micromonospora phytophila]|uniref:hypothetical protein n=1 Tax=Micromonospora phytophila TaxID=709888 RepID=UPI00203054BB